MPNPGTEFLPPAYSSSQVLFGNGYLWTAPFATALPADIDLGDLTKWVGWTYVGATDQGVQIQFSPNMNEINIEETPIPIASLVQTATFQISAALSEESLVNINLAYGGGGSIATQAQATGVPGKKTLTLSSNFATLACAILAKNDLGFPRVFYVPKIMSAGQVQTNFRRAADKRMYPITLNSLTDLANCQVIDIISAAL
jgi:hypothetical protein